MCVRQYRHRIDAGGTSFIQLGKCKLLDLYNVGFQHVFEAFPAEVRICARPYLCQMASSYHCHVQKKEPYYMIVHMNL